MDNLFDNLKILGIGAAGFTGTELAQIPADPNPGGLQNIISLLTQLAIGVATLWGLLKKKKKTTEK